MKTYAETAGQANFALFSSWHSLCIQTLKGAAVLALLSARNNDGERDALLRS